MSLHSGKAAGNVTSFRKKGADTLNIRGTRISSQNAQLLTSTGSSTLDFFIGGGLAIGTVCLIEEDCYNSYSSLLVKYFLSEGIANRHALFLSSGGKPSKQILTELPSIRVPEVRDHVSDSVLNENLKIAWRYQSQTSTLASGIKTSSHNHGYDLSKPMPDDILQNSIISTWDPLDGSEEPTLNKKNFLESPYSVLLQKIRYKLESDGFKTSIKTNDNVMRIALPSLGSPLWVLESGVKQEVQILRFVYMLKALLRTSFAVAVITMPSYLTQNEIFASRIRQTCDTVIGLESFIGSDKRSNPLFKEFDGLLRVVKLPVLNTYIYPFQISDLAFKLKRRDFIIERLHLPPEFEDSQAEPSSFGCSGQPSKIDF